MNTKTITSIIIAVILIAVVILIVGSKKVPLCYAVEEQNQSQGYTTYGAKVITDIKNQINITPFYSINIVGKSMEPTIKNGERCVCIPQRRYSKGDIVSFYSPVSATEVELIAHRIVEDNILKFQTKGDGNNVQDPFEIDKGQVFCKIPEKTLFEKFQFSIMENANAQFKIIS